MKELLTTRQVAQALGTSEASLKRWCDRGRIPAVRTVGGHRRLPVNGVIQFLRQTGFPVARPELLGLPPAVEGAGLSFERARHDLRTALEAGDETTARQIVRGLYVSGHSVCTISDELIAPAFRDIGDRWRHGEIEVYEERRGCEVCMRVLLDLRKELPPAPADGPTAIGGTLEGDAYALPTLMAELVLREEGWRAHSLGVGLPCETLAAAIRKERPRLFWLSVSAIANAEDFLVRYQKLYQTAAGWDCPIVVGGRALTRDIRRRMPYAAYGDNLLHLRSFARSLRKT